MRFIHVAYLQQAGMLKTIIQVVDKITIACVPQNISSASPVEYEVEFK